MPRPDPSSFSTGDLVWPKKPGAYVPYNSGSINSPETDRENWITERNTYVQHVIDSKTTDRVQLDRAQALKAMDFREFLAIYAGAQKPGVPGLYSGGALYVGHVGIIEVDSNRTPWIIEAVMGKGVVRTTYADWITERSDQVVWLGRIRQLDQGQRVAIAREAKRHLGQPYDFWNFDLNDDAGFYCSKLVWLSVFRSLKFAIDADTDTKRILWLSPKQILYLPVIERLHDPGPYAFS